MVEHLRLKLGFYFFRLQCQSAAGFGELLLSADRFQESKGSETKKEHLQFLDAI